MTFDIIAARARLAQYDPLLNQAAEYAEAVERAAARPTRQSRQVDEDGLTPGQRDMLADLLAAGSGHVPGGLNVASMIQGLRLKLGKEAIETAKGQGYRLSSAGVKLARELLV